MKDFNTGIFAFMLLLAAATYHIPASAQVDLAGAWYPRLTEDWQERGPGPDSVDYVGMPINEQARTRALSYSGSQISMTERQCINYPPTYLVMSPFGMKIWADYEPTTGAVMAWNISPVTDRSAIKIWVDGRPRPSAEALHTFGGFTTGTWVGQTLVTLSTHFKAGYIRRNGVPSSDQATMRLYMTRHDNLLSVMAMIEDPVYLTEPYVLTREWVLDPTGMMRTATVPCVPAVEISEGQSVHHYLPGENPMIGDSTERLGIPRDALMGGAATMYPEFSRALKPRYSPPLGACQQYCCGWGGPTDNENKLLQCKGYVPN